MKTLFKSLSALCLTLFLCCALCCTASAATNGVFKVTHDQINANGKPYGADITFSITNSEKKQVSVLITKCYKDEPVDIPLTVDDYDEATEETTTYTVSSLTLNWAASSNLNTTLTVPDELRDIQGNLFDHTKTATRNVDANSTSGAQGFIVRGPSTINAPNTKYTLDAIKPFISEHYDKDGAYYAGKCLVRLDPEHEGDYTVKDGTVCILASAFEGCSKLGKVTLPSSIEFIGMRAFANSSVTSVNIPAGVTDHYNKLECLTFYNCKNLTNVTFDEGAEVDFIGYAAFMDCTSLEDFDFSKSNNYSFLCFAGAFNSEKNVTVEIRPEQLNDSAGQFARTGIKSVTFLENKSQDDYGKRIPSWCFYRCENLDTVTLSKSVTNIGAWCFEGCRKITEDVLAQENCAVTFLDYRCFAKTSMKEVTIPESVGSMSGGVFAKCPTIKKLNYHSTFNGSSLFAVLNDCTDSGTSSSEVMTSTTTSFGGGYAGKPAKKDNTYIEELELYDPHNCSHTFTFSLQPYLRTVTIHNSEDSNYAVSEYMFQFCPSLTAVTFDHPEKVTRIGYTAFAFCPSLHSFPFTKMTGLESIGENAFLLSSNGTGYSKNEIANWSKTDPRLEYGLQGELDLGKCTKLYYIDEEAFEMQLNVTSVKLPEKVKLGGCGGTFVGCSSLKTLTADCPPTNLWGDTPGFGDCFYVNVSGSYYNGRGSYIPVQNDVMENVILNNAETFTTEYNGYKYSFFTNCVGLKNVTLKKCTSLPPSLFVNCIGLENVNLPDTVVIGTPTDSEDFASVFFGTKDFTINAPNAETVSRNAFLYSGVKEANLPKVKTLGTNAFSYAGPMDKLTLPSVTTVGDQAFMFSKIKEIDLPKAESIGSNAFWTYDISIEKLSLPSLKTVPDYAFQFGKIKEIDLSSAETIGSNAFFLADTMEKLYLPSVTTVGDQAFMFSRIKEIDLPKAESIGNNAFWTYNISIEKLSLPSLKTVPDYAFQLCNIKEIDLSGAETIGTNAFFEFGPMEKLALPSVKSVGDQAFLYSEIKEIDLPKAETIGMRAFMYSDKLTTVSLPSVKEFAETEQNVTTYGGNGTFAYCGSLETVTLGESLKRLPADAFMWSGLKKFNVPANVEFGPYLFFGCDKLEEVTFDEGVTELGWFMFNYCSSLKTVTLPDTLETVSWAAFKDCKNLTEISIPASVKVIDDDAFAMWNAPKVLNESLTTATGDTPEMAIHLAGTPEIKTRLTREDYEERRPFMYSSLDDDEETLALLPIPDGSIAACDTTEGFNKALAYKQTMANDLILGYAVSVEENEYGTISADKTYANKGDTINVTAAPKIGCKLNKVMCNGEELTPAEGVYSFAMPESGAFVSADMSPVPCTVTWKNYDDTVLAEETLNYGDVPEYKGNEPTKEGTAEHSYTFLGWAPEINALTGDVTYTAQFSEAVNSYKVTWQNDDKTVLETDEVLYGETPEYNGKTPVKENTAKYTYAFKGWTPKVDVVTGDVTYTAEFTETVNTFTVKWANEDGKILETDENVPYGTMPEYNGKAPSSGENKTFTGWNPEIKEVTDSVTYTAAYKQELVKDTEANSSDTTDVETDTKSSDTTDVETDTKSSDTTDVETDTTSSDTTDVETDTKSSDTTDVETDTKSSDTTDVETDTKSSDTTDVETDTNETDTKSSDTTDVETDTKSSDTTDVETDTKSSDTDTDDAKDTDSAKESDSDKPSDTDSGKTPESPDEPEPEKTAPLGDVNNDNVVDATDALLILRASLGLDTFTEEQSFFGDVDEDGMITSNDALEVLRYSISLPSIAKIGTMAALKKS